MLQAIIKISPRVCIWNERSSPPPPLPWRCLPFPCTLPGPNLHGGDRVAATVKGLDSGLKLLGFISWLTTSSFQMMFTLFHTKHANWGGLPAKQLLDRLSTPPPAPPRKSIAPGATNNTAPETIKELSAPFSSREQFIRLQFSLGTTNGYNNGNDTLVFCRIMEMEASISSTVQFSFLDWITLIGFHQCFSNLPVH